MGVGKKYDHDPLLPPGRHRLTLAEIENITVAGFDGNLCRRGHFHRLEEFVQALLIARICCEVWVDGSFVTVKEDPDDVDVSVMIDHDVAAHFSPEQQALVDSIEMSPAWEGLDIFVFVKRAKDDPLYGDELHDPAFDWHEQWGKEHNGEWLKGIAVLRLGETRVGLRICS